MPKRNIIFIIVTFLMIGLVLSLSKMRKRNLLKNHHFSKGYIIKVTNYRGKKIQFTFEDREESYFKPSMTSSNACTRKVSQMLKFIQKHKYKFPVVYHPESHENSEILLFESQYKKFQIEIPEDLKEIVTKLSVCEH